MTIFTRPGLFLFAARLGFFFGFFQIWRQYSLVGSGSLDDDSFERKRVKCNGICVNFNTLFVDKSEVPEVLRTGLFFFSKKRTLSSCDFRFLALTRFVEDLNEKKGNFRFVIEKIWKIILCVDAREEVTAPGVGSDCGLRRRKFSGFLLNGHCPDAAGNHRRYMMARWVLRHSFKRLLLLSCLVGTTNIRTITGNTHENKIEMIMNEKRNYNEKSQRATIPVIINAKNINALIGQV